MAAPGVGALGGADYDLPLYAFVQNMANQFGPAQGATNGDPDELTSQNRSVAAPGPGRIR
jgi:hypothetical protein